MKPKSYKVVFNNLADRSLEKIPAHIKDKLFAWIFMVESVGLPSTRNYRGFRDEALIGNRKGQRSIRLNKAYRAIYIVISGNSSEVVRILEVNKHEY